MKTIKTTIALLFAAVAFTACTHESIEPVRPVMQSPTVMKADTNQTVIREEYGDEPTLLKHYKLPTETQPSYPTTPKPMIPSYPAPVKNPRPAGQPVMLADSLAG